MDENHCCQITQATSDREKKKGFHEFKLFASNYGVFSRKKIIYILFKLIFIKATYIK